MFNESKRGSWTCCSQRLFGSGRLWIALWNGLCQRILNSYAADRRWSCRRREADATVPPEKERRLFRVALLASSADRLNLSRSPCCRASLACQFASALLRRAAHRDCLPRTRPPSNRIVKSRRFCVVVTCQAAGVFSARETGKISFTLWLTIVFVILL